MRNIRLLLGCLALGTFGLSIPAYAQSTNPDAPKRAHCVAKDGKELAATNRKECKQAGGKWRRVKPEPNKS